MMVKKTKSNTLKKDATLALANLLLIGALTDNSAKAESKKDDTDLKLVSHNVYMLSTVLYPNRINKKSRINMLMPHKQPFSLSLLLISWLLLKILLLLHSLVVLNFTFLLLPFV